MDVAILVRDWESWLNMGASATNRDALLARLFGDEAVPSSLSDELLRTRDVARAFQVSERTVAEWARRGRIPSVRTPGGHRLYPADKIRDLLRRAEAGDTEASPATLR